eukprot:1159364-Pelagomonas_calceolata.AAC.8
MATRACLALECSLRALLLKTFTSKAMEAKAQRDKKKNKPCSTSLCLCRACSPRVLHLQPKAALAFNGGVPRKISQHDRVEGRDPCMLGGHHKTTQAQQRGCCNGSEHSGFACVRRQQCSSAAMHVQQVPAESHWVMPNWCLPHKGT